MVKIKLTENKIKTKFIPSRPESHAKMKDSNFEYSIKYLEETQ